MTGTPAVHVPIIVPVSAPVVRGAFAGSGSVFVPERPLVGVHILDGFALVVVRGHRLCRKFRVGHRCDRYLLA